MSTRINLLPYRDDRRAAAKRQFTILAVGVVGLALGLAALIHVAMGGYVGLQDQRNIVLGTEIATLDKRIDEIKTLQSEIDALKSRKAVIETLQFERATGVQILDQMVRLTPEGIYLKSIKQADGVVNVTGYSMSNDLVSSFMTSISQSHYIENPVLVEIKAASEGQRRVGEFSLNFSLARPKEAVDPAAPVRKASVPAVAVQ